MLCPLLRGIQTRFTLPMFELQVKRHNLVMGVYDLFIECRKECWVWRNISFVIEWFIIFVPQLPWILLFFQASCASRAPVVSEVVNCGPNARYLRLLLGVVSFTCDLFQILLEDVHSPTRAAVLVVSIGTGVFVWGGLSATIMGGLQDSCDGRWGSPISKRPTGLGVRNVEDIFRRMISIKNGLRLILTLLSSSPVLLSRPTTPLLCVFHLLFLDNFAVAAELCQ